MAKRISGLYAVPLSPGTPGYGPALCSIRGILLLPPGLVLISGPFAQHEETHQATMAITPVKVRNASNMLLFCDFVSIL